MRISKSKEGPAPSTAQKNPQEARELSQSQIQYRLLRINHPQPQNQLPANSQSPDLSQLKKPKPAETYIPET